MPPTTPPGRCPAAHPEDPTPCEGPAGAVLIRDRFMSRAREAMAEGVPACVHHGARMLTSLDGGRVHVGSLPGAAVETFQRAADLTPFCWLREES